MSNFRPKSWVKPFEKMQIFRSSKFFFYIQNIIKQFIFACFIACVAGYLF